MNDRFYEATINSCRTVLKPIVKMFLNLGVSHKAFSDIAKSVYVDVAVEECPERKNISDIALRTGISRKEVGKVLDKIEEQTLITSEKLALDKIIVEWYQSVEYTDLEGLPMPLPVKSVDGPTLEGLVRTAKLDIPFSTTLRLIHESNRIQIDQNGKYIPVSRIALFEGMNVYELRHVAGMVYGFLDTVEKNLQNAGVTDSKRLFQRCAYVPNLSPEKLNEFVVYCDDRLPQLLIEFDDWLSANSKGELGVNPNQGLTGVGVYIYDYKSLPYP